jgi:O-antigen ligase
MKTKYHSWIGTAIFIVLFVYFSLGLIQAKVANACFYLLLLLGGIGLALSIGNKGAAEKIATRTYFPLFLAMAGMLLAIVVNQVFRQQFSVKAYDDPSRLALAGVLIFIIAWTPMQTLSKLRWAFAAGAILGTIKIAVLTNGGQIRTALVDFIPIIAYSQLVLLTGMFSVLSINRDKDKGKIKASLLALAMIAGLYNAYMSQTRGTWIAIPLFVTLICLTLMRKMHSRKLAGYSAAILLGLTILFGITQIVRERIAEADRDIELYAQKQNMDTSIGTRFQLWHGSWIIFKENPIYGVGRDEFSAALAGLEKRGIITPSAASFPHSHNEVLYNMATLGIFGLFAILGIYFVPAYYFVREIRHVDLEIRAAAAMGLSLCLGYLIFGLVDVMFMWRQCDIFYAVACSVFIVFIAKRKIRIANSSVDANAIAGFSSSR